MPRHEERRILPFSAERMYAIVADIEKYPEFVPGCAALRIRERRTEDATEVLIADMVVAYRGLRERYTSLVRADPATGTVTATQVEGPFAMMQTEWRFSPHGEGCEVRFQIEFEFRSRLLSAMAGTAFESMARKMTDAFVARAGATEKTSSHTSQ